jgi:hypothetical protein
MKEDWLADLKYEEDNFRYHNKSTKGWVAHMYAKKLVINRMMMVRGYSRETAMDILNTLLWERQRQENDTVR